MIDNRALRFFQHLPRLKTSDNGFFSEVSDIPMSIVDSMYDLAKTVELPPRLQKKYAWYRNDATHNLYSKDLCNIDGVAAHEHYQKVFNDQSAIVDPGFYSYDKNYNSNARQISWAPEYQLFKNSLASIGKQWRWCLLIRIDPMGWWSPKYNHPTPEEQDGYKLYWIPLNYVKNRLIAATGVGYFEPNVGKIYTLDGINHQYSTINIGMEPMYNLLGTCIR